MSYRDEIEDAQERAQMDFTRKLLDKPHELTHDDYAEARASISEIIHIATNVLKMPMDELSLKLVSLRNYAAYSHVDIQLPHEIERASEAAYFNSIHEQRANKSNKAGQDAIDEERTAEEKFIDAQVNEYLASKNPTPLVRESSRAGLLRYLNPGRENS